MDRAAVVAVIIPVRDEVNSIGAVVEAVRAELDAEVFVVDNGSRDGSGVVAARHGARVIGEARRGYGWACRTGCAAAAGSDVVVIIDGDGSMAAADIHRLLQPILNGQADIVCGARPLASAAMPWHQRAGNHVIGLLLRTLYGLPLRELGPFRAVRVAALTTLDLPGSRYAWPAQMLARAARAGMRVAEVPVGYADRTGGRSKVGGSARGSLGAAWGVGWALIGERLR